MSEEVQFNENPVSSSRTMYVEKPGKSKFLRFLESVTKKFGVPEEYTDYALLAFAGIIIIISIVIFHNVIVPGEAKPRPMASEPKDFIIIHNHAL